MWPIYHFALYNCCENWFNLPWYSSRKSPLLKSIVAKPKFVNQILFLNLTEVVLIIKKKYQKLPLLIINFNSASNNSLSGCRKEKRPMALTLEYGA